MYQKRGKPREKGEQNELTHNNAIVTYSTSNHEII